MYIRYVYHNIYYSNSILLISVDIMLSSTLSFASLLFFCLIVFTSSFSPYIYRLSPFESPIKCSASGDKKSRAPSLLFANNKYSKERRNKLGLGDDDDEYDLDVALSQNTDSTITKVIAGSFILTVFALLFVAIIQPALNPVEGMCNPLLTQGRC